MTGPLEGLRIIEVGGIGPVPFAAMMLADHGAEVIRIDHADPMRHLMGPLLRSRKSVALDLKSSADARSFRDICKTADGIVEGFRPGVMERLGIGPDVLLGDTPKLIYGRMTGWGQDGPDARQPGHDINYIARAGVLSACGRAGEPPVPPLNLVADFGGGGMLLAFAMVSALLAVQRGGSGQVIDCAMTEGAALLMTMIWGLRGSGQWRDAAGTNLLDTGAPFYNVYTTADDKFVAVGAIEPQFFAALCAKLDLAGDPDFLDQHDQARWPAQKQKLSAIFRSQTRRHWEEAFAGSDACFSPVLSMREATTDPHNLARQSFISVGGITQPAPAPRYSQTPCGMPSPAPDIGQDQAMLAQWIRREP